MAFLIEPNKNNTEMCLISIQWSIQGIHSLLHVLEGIEYNTAFSIDVTIPSQIENITSGSRKKTSKGWMIHMDNADLHNSRSSQECIRASKAEQSPHPAESPEIAPGQIS
jgi:hypothetical protein